MRVADLADLVLQRATKRLGKMRVSDFRNSQGSFLDSDDIVADVLNDNELVTAAAELDCEQGAGSAAPAPRPAAAAATQARAPPVDNAAHAASAATPPRPEQERQAPFAMPFSFSSQIPADGSSQRPAFRPPPPQAPFDFGIPLPSPGTGDAPFVFSARGAGPQAQAAGVPRARAAAAHRAHRSILERLDDGVLRSILLSCDDRDLWALNLTCGTFRDLLAEPTFWAERVRRYFPKTPARLVSAYSGGPKGLYLSLLRPKVHAASPSGMSVIWLDGGHLRRVADPDSDAREVVVVRNVCWLEMKGELRGVLRGTYRALWRLRVEQGADLDNVTFSVGVPREAGEGCTRRWRPAEYLLHGGRGWFVLEVGRLKITTPSATVAYSLRSTEQMWWKSGLAVDYFHIAPTA